MNWKLLYKLKPVTVNSCLFLLFFGHCNIFIGYLVHFMRSFRSVVINFLVVPETWTFSTVAVTVCGRSDPTLTDHFHRCVHFFKNKENLWKYSGSGPITDATSG